MDPLDLDWTRPLGALAFLLPVALLLLARVRTRPPSRATGTFALWRRIAASTPADARRHRPRTPPAVWLLALALALGALALAGPEIERPRIPLTWTVVVDHGPSTALAWRADDGPAGPGAPSRLERALDTLAVWLDDAVGEADRVRWLSSAKNPFETVGGALPPRRWLAHPDWPAAEPEWGLHDRRGVVWVTDRAPGIEALRAGLVASGGGAVYGAIAAVDGRRLDWNGVGIEGVPDAVAERDVVLIGRERLPEPLTRLLGVWARARGLGIRSTPSGEPGRTALVVRAVAGEGASVAVRFGRDGWSAEGLAWPSDLPPASQPRPWEVWLAASASGDGPGGSALVRVAPGRVRVALTAMGEPRGDPAAFAVSWAELLDRVTLPPPGIVALEERLAAGPPRRRDPEPPGAAAGPEGGGVLALPAWLAGGSALCALLAFAAGLLRAAGGGAAQDPSGSTRP